jgi:hypothetical protein
MYDQQLHELRREKWRLTGRSIRTLDDAREFIDSAGFCLLYPERPAVLMPTFVGAYKGSDDKLPAAHMAFADPDAHQAKELMVRLLREKSAYHANVFPENNFLVSAAVFPFFYGLVGDRNPRQMPKPGARSEYSPLAVDALQVIGKEGPISKHRIQELLGGEISEAALDRALDELWAKLRITRVDYKPDAGIFWDVLFRWSSDAVKEGIQLSLAESLTALVSKYVDCVVAVSQEELEQFFSHFVGRARVREAVNALQAARELSFAHVGGRVLLQSASMPVPPPEPPQQQEIRPKPAFEARPPRSKMRNIRLNTPRRPKPAEETPAQTTPEDSGNE